MIKSELVRWLQAEYQKREAFLDQIGMERMDQPGVNGDWSMKDIVAHPAGGAGSATMHWLAAPTYRQLTGCTAPRTRTAPTLARAPTN